MKNLSKIIGAVGVFLIIFAFAAAAGNAEEAPIPQDVRSTAAAIINSLSLLEDKQLELSEAKSVASQEQKEYDIISHTVEVLKGNLNRRGYSYDYENQKVVPYDENLQ